MFKCNGRILYDLNIPFEIVLKGLPNGRTAVHFRKLELVVLRDLNLAFLYGLVVDARSSK
jgi:hypothetical protein